jgi:hypothetical protein
MERTSYDAPWCTAVVEAVFEKHTHGEYKMYFRASTLHLDRLHTAYVRRPSYPTSIWNITPLVLLIETGICRCQSILVT